MSIVRIDKNTTSYLKREWTSDSHMKVWAFGTHIFEKGTYTHTGMVSQMTSSRTTYQPTDWNYRQRIREHLNATTNLTGFKYEEVKRGDNGYCFILYEGKDPNLFDNPFVPMHWKVRGRLVPIQWLPGDPNTYAPPTTDADREARFRLLKKIRQSYEAFQGLTFLGELRETVGMLRRPMQALREGMGDYLGTVKKRASKTPASSLSSMLSGTWLEYVFGWRPLISDIGNATEAINNTLERYEDSYEYFSAIGRVELPWSGFGYYTTMQNGPWTIHHRHRYRGYALVRYYGQVFRAALVHDRLSRVNLGLTLDNFVPTVWELIPYSFLADYFANTGELLEAVTTNTSGVRWISRDLIRGVQDEWSIDRISRNTNSQPDSTVRNVRVLTDFSPSILESRRVERSWLSEPPTVGLSDFQWRIPGVGSQKWTNMSALAAQQASVQRFLQRLR